MVSGTYLNCSHETCATCPNSPPSTPPLLMTSSPIGFLAVVGMCQAPWPRDLCSGCSLCLACSLCRRWPLRCSNVTFWTSFSLTILFHHTIVGSLRAWFWFPSSSSSPLSTTLSHGIKLTVLLPQCLLDLSATLLQDQPFLAELLH